MPSPTPPDIYELTCDNLKVPTDDKIMRAFMDVSKTGELNISGLSVTVQLCEVLAQTLPQCPDVDRLSVSDCLLPAAGLAALLNSLHLTRIHRLQLKGNNISGPSVYKLSTMLARSSNIKFLGLEWNNLGLCLEGMSQFCSALAANHSLEALDLRNNQLDEACARLLAAALRKNTSLRALDVRWNSMEQVGGQYFLSALQTNKTLTTLKLQGNSLSNDLLTALEQCVQHNRQLLQLESGYEARKELLTSHTQAINHQRVQELQQWADKSQRQLSEYDAKMKEYQTALVDKQDQIQGLEKLVSELNHEVEAGRGRERLLQEELRRQEESHAATLRDYQLQLDTVNKALAANKMSQSALEERLEEQRILAEAVEKERGREKDKIRLLELQIKRSKEELQKTITDNIEAVEEERRQSQQRLSLAEEEWRMRAEQSQAEHSRAEQVYRDRLRSLETALEQAEQGRVELSGQWGAERARWAEERASIWAEAKEKESCKMIILAEKVDHLKEEKASLESQLGVANTTTQQVQRDNSCMVADLADLRRRLSSLQEELSAERLMCQRLRSEKAEDQRAVEGVRAELSGAQRAVAEASSHHEELRREMRRLTERLEDKERQIGAIRKEEKDRAGLLVAAIKSYVEQVNTSGS